MARFNYLLWAMSRYLLADKSCPSCSSSETHLIKRKYLVTSLYECASCKLRFRVPKDSQVKNQEFYQDDYTEGFTTELPSDDELSRMLSSSFKGMEKDLSPDLNILKLIGLQPGQSVYDFGCSWGYASWQLRQAGYKVYSFEIGRSRARFAKEKLGCIFEEPLEPVDCFFSSHVIEHLPDPNILWKTASRILKPGGIVYLLMPNGEPHRESSVAGYHSIWGEAHPLLLNAEALQHMAKRHQFKGACYSTPYDESLIRAGIPAVELNGDGLLFVARR
ncbi:MAG TPA: class I SAM-dependent methyltransferase [Pyrinomonadaceae bacterium]|nr:class I SAM-dependent methyltransferase [Pyrinomonadaceae bacterium]